MTLEVKLAKSKKRLEQMQARLEAQKARLAIDERNARTHRLIVEGATLEDAAGGVLSIKAIYDLVASATDNGWQRPSDENTD